MKLSIEKSVAVITPTIGSLKLKDAVISVQNQSYGNVEHIVVLDGSDIIIPEMDNENGIVFIDHIIELPQNTGKTNGNWYGHRIYAAIPMLLNHDYICFLDEDNWFEPNHIETLVKKHEDNHIFDFVFSLRKIFNENKDFITNDDCESLGQYPIWFTHDNPQYLIDTSSFLFTRNFIQTHSHKWFHGWGGDRNFLNSVRELAQFACTGEYTLCYRLSGNEQSVSPQFFIEGNKKQEMRYNGEYPWRKL